jgi:hypothetical protein
MGSVGAFAFAHSNPAKLQGRARSAFRAGTTLYIVA